MGNVVNGQCGELSMVSGEWPFCNWEMLNNPCRKETKQGFTIDH